MNKPVCWIIAGPNGAGKTTFALEFLPQVANCQKFVNADLIAAGLSPFSPESELLSASRLFLKEIQANIVLKKDFSFETTLSGRGYLRLIKRLRNEGWQVELLYLALPSVEMSKLRVSERVEHGGHNIPLKDIERRFPRSLSNLLNFYSYEVDNTRCFLNKDKLPELIFEQHGSKRIIKNESLFQLMVEGSQL